MMNLWLEDKTTNMVSSQFGEKSFTDNQAKREKLMADRVDVNIKNNLRSK